MTEQTTDLPADGGDTPELQSPSLANAVRSAIHRLYSSSSGESVIEGRGQTATRAQLRNAVGRSPEQSLMAWTTVVGKLLPEFPDDWTSTDEPSRQEWAAFTALTHWAMHQQAIPSAMHVTAKNRGHNFGHSVGRLAVARNSESTKARFDALLLSPGEASTLHHLRSLVQLLRASSISTDYGLLAEDLAALRRPGGRQRVALRWGRGFARGAAAGRAKQPSETT
ncbi:type I-E CRISPR-associated protein Cse2/CasB [Nesterenkonia marinintestina]|uniref:type I-E CRISPR-associated protein Cse2/CasB n=1 Tax=Nesterenkonia marinintestina TaxID=2979865 RepID=UPI0036F3B594